MQAPQTGSDPSASRRRVAVLEPLGAASDAEEDATFSAAVAALTAAFGDESRRAIYLFVGENGGATAAEVGRHFHLHPNVARHHLDKLAAGGYLDVALEHPAGGAGRPAKRYRRSARPAEVPMPPRPDLLVGNLLVRCLELLEPERAEQLALEVGEEYGRSLAAQMAPGEAQRSMRAAMSAVADALTAHGFAAHAGVGAEQMTVFRTSCPFGSLVDEHPVLCAIDRGIVQGMLAGLCKDSVPVALSSRALGDAACASVAG